MSTRSASGSSATMRSSRCMRSAMVRVLSGGGSSGSDVEADALEPELEHVAERQAFEVVVTLAPDRRDGHQSSIEQHPQVAGRGRPGVGEASAELAGGQGAAPGMEHLEHM